MHFSIAALVAASLASSVSATGWSDAKPFSSPDNTNNQCSDAQKSGYNWSGLPEGSFSSYGSNTFSGFTCTNSFGKRDGLTARTFQDKCIQGNIQDHPSISCNSGKSMSIQQMHVSADHDTQVECNYQMPDNSVCKTTHSCSAQGSIINNEQCGGATAVTFKPVAGDNRPCNVNVHDISFNCGPASSSSVATSSKPATTSSSTVTSSSKPVTTSSSIATSSSTPVTTSSSLVTSLKPATSSSFVAEHF